MKSKVSFDNPQIETSLILYNQKELNNMQAKILALKSIFMNEIYNLRQEISSVLPQIE